MTRKNAKKTRARLRQQKHGGPYQQHYQVEGEPPANSRTAETLSDLRAAYDREDRLLLVSEDETAALSVSPISRELSGLAVNSWSFEPDGSIRQARGTTLIGFHALSLRNGLEAFVGDRPGLVDDTRRHREVRTLRELRAMFDPLSVLMYPEGSAFCFRLHRWGGGVLLERWAVAPREGTVAWDSEFALRHDDAKLLRDAVTSLVAIPSRRFVSELDQIACLRECALEAVGYVRVVFDEDRELRGAVLRSSDRNTGSAPWGYSGTIILRTDDGRAHWLDLADAERVEPVSPAWDSEATS